jgi:Ca2+:H+ antiporter
MVHYKKTPAWTWVLPLAGLVFFAGATFAGFDASFASTTLGLVLAAVLIPLLVGAVFAAVYHAEEAAHQTGEPFGTLILTIAVTIIELALIISLLLTGKASPTLVRDTVYAVIMIITTGLVGLCIVTGGLKFREQVFDVTAAKIYLVVLIVLASLTLILPNYTSTVPGPEYSNGQIAFVSFVTLLLYGVYLYSQTVLYRGYFIGSGDESASADASSAKLFKAILLLVLALAAVIVLAKLFSAVVTFAVAAVGAPITAVGVIIALIVLTPESIAAVKAARDDNLQKSLNLALGSSIATIGLTIPAMAVANAIFGKHMVLGLEARDVTLVVTTLAASILTFGTGRTNVLFGFVHLVLFAVFIFLVFVP